ncbi:MAG: hypothetical protein KBS61_09390 [Chryseobacterium sp.]|nr:hypothetical protein [Candidatus Chryseobacterium enterohippi]
MKLHASVFAIILLSTGVIAQKGDKTSKQDVQIIEHFRNSYKKKNYQKFTGKITKNFNQIIFDDKALFIAKGDKLSLLLLEKGLIYPQLIRDFELQKFVKESTDKTQLRYLKYQKNPSASFEVNNEVIKITELNFLNVNEKIKRFKINLKNNSIPSSRTFFIELTNKNATKDTKIEDFVKYSSLTFLSKS